MLSRSLQRTFSTPLCEERVLNSEHFGRRHLSNNSLKLIQNPTGGGKRLKSFVQSWLVCLDERWKVCSCLVSWLVGLVGLVGLFG